MQPDSEIGAQKEAAERELLQFDKVGRCVNGVAHDVNNCLGAILAYAELCSMDGALSAESRRMVGRIIESVDRASALVTELTNVARPQKKSQGLIDLRHLVRGLALLREYELRIKQVVLVQEYPEEVPSLSGDVAQIRLALLYLLSNCEEAVNSAGERQINIRLSVQDQGLALSFHTPVPIVPEVQAAMFERGFSTRGLPHAGLGLGVARSIIEEHGGTLTYSQQEGFVVFLPYIGPA